SAASANARTRIIRVEERQEPRVRIERAGVVSRIVWIRRHRHGANRLCRRLSILEDNRQRGRSGTRAKVFHRESSASGQISQSVGLRQLELIQETIFENINFVKIDLS